MTSYSLIIISVIPIIIVASFVLRQSHLLISLLSLEGLILRIVLTLPLILSIGALKLAILRVVILTLGACEARLGLALIVIMARNYGSDMVSNLSINKC